MIEQLISPADNRKVRDMDDKHVDTLVKQFNQGGFSQVSSMIGVVFGDMLKDLSLVEVIGGNHTREALKRVSFKGKVSVRLYHNLTDEECLSIGYKHNKIHEFAKANTFIEVIIIIKHSRV